MSGRDPILYGGRRFRVADHRQAFDWLATFNLGTLISAGADGWPRASASPLVIRADDQAIQPLLGPIVLVGHSGAGLLLPLIADTAAPPVSKPRSLAAASSTASTHRRFPASRPGCRGRSDRPCAGGRRRSCLCREPRARRC